MTISDDFSDGTLDAAWQVFGPGPAVEGATATDGILSLSTPNGSYDAWGANTTARVMQASADDDFTLETRFLSTPTKQYQMQGLLVEQDANNWLRFDTYSDGSKLYAFAAITINGVSAMQFKVAVPGGSAPYLRVDRVGDVWTVQYSVDGAAWVTAGSFGHTMNVTQSGVFAGNVGPAAAFTAQIDYFETSADPLLAEDAAFTPTNQPPAPMDDAFALDMDGAVTFSAADLLVNDTDPDGPTPQLVSVGTPGQGTLVDNGDDTYTYTPPVGFAGTDSLVYTVTDGTDQATANVVLTISDPNAATTNAQSDDFSGGTLDPIWTVTGPAGISHTLTADTTDAWLELATPDGTYDAWQTNTTARAMQAVADDDFVLETRFLSTPTRQYQMQGLLIEADANNWMRFDTYSDGSKLSAFAAVTVNGVTTAKFQMPVAGNVAPYLRVERAGDVWTLTYSTDGTNWTTAGSFSHVIDVAQAGVFAGNVGPATGFVAKIDYFEVDWDPITNEDGSLAGANTAPDAIDDAFAVAHDTALTFATDTDLLGNDTDPQGDTLTLTSISQPQNGSLTDNGDGTYTYMPTTGFSGVDTFSYTISDGEFSDTATVSISVASPPGSSTSASDDFSASTLAGVWTLNGAPAGDIAFGQNAQDAYLDLTATGNKDAWQTNNTARIMQASDDVDFVLETRFLSTPTAQYQMQGLLAHDDADTWLRFDTYSDGSKLYAFAAYTNNGTSTQRLRVEVSGNSAPYLKVGRAGDVWTMQYSTDGANWATVGSFTQAIAITQVGVFAGNTGASSAFTARVDYFDTSLAPLTSEDGNISPPDLPPVAVDDSYTVMPDGTLSVNALDGVLANDDDPDGSGLSVVVDTGPQHGTLSLNSDGSFSYVAQGGYVGADSFTYNVTDGSGDTAQASVLLEPTGSVAEPQSDDFSDQALDPVWVVSGPASTSATNAVVGPDGVLLLTTPDGTFDAWGANSTVRAMQATDDIDFQLKARFVSTPTNGYEMQGFLIEQDSANWLRLDVYSNGSQIFAFGAVTVNGTTSMKFNTAISAAQAEFLRATRTGDTWTLETSADGTTWSASGSFGHALNVDSVGLFSGNVGGASGYTAMVDYFENTALPIVDEDGTVTPGNNAPVAVDDGMSTLVDMSLIIDPAADLLANDTDFDGDTLSIASLGTPANGVLSNNGDGTYTYTPNAGFSGVDTISYDVTDGTESDTGTLSISVVAPVISDDFAGGPLAPEWTFYGIDGFAQIATTTTDGFVEIVSPPGVAVSASDVLTTPRLLQAQADVDFQISAGFLDEPSQKYQENGLLVVQDDSNWIRFDLAYTGGQLTLIVGVIEDGVTSYPLFAPVPTGQVQHFRVGRNGDTFDFQTSADGTTWTSRYSLTHAIEVTKVGMFAGSTSFDGAIPGFAGKFDYFQNDANPILNEDGTLVPTNVAPRASDDTLVVDADATHIINIASALLANDVDSNGDAVTFQGFAQPQHGTLIDNNNGTLSYVADGGYSGPDSFTYTITDGALTDTATVDMVVGSPINVWHGGTQHFATQGAAQRWINILGDVELPVTSLAYSLNGGAMRALSVGADGRRLQNSGDFNIDIAYAELDGSATDDVVTISATLGDGSVLTRDVVVEYEVGQTWAPNYSIDWSTVTDLQDVVQVVDGTWAISNGGVRPVDLGYDRLLVLGDHTWDNYEVNLSITTHDLLNVDPKGRDGGGFALGMLWGGHTDTPISGWQPKVGWEPGAAFFFTDNDQNGVGKLDLHPSRNFFNTLATTTLDLDEGLTYNFTMRVEQVNLYDRQYSLKIWEDGASEPAGWTLQGVQTYALSDEPATGSLYLNAHYMDVAFNNLTVTEITGRDIVKGLDGDDRLSAVDPLDASPGQGEIDVFVGGLGADTFVLGDAAGTYYDDGQTGTSGHDDYALVWDFESGTDRFELAGNATDYVLAEDVAGLSSGTAIMVVNGGGPGEVIGLAYNVLGLDLNSDDFFFTGGMA